MFFIGTAENSLNIILSEICDKNCKLSINRQKVRIFAQPASERLVVVNANKQRNVWLPFVVIALT